MDGHPLPFANVEGGDRICLVREDISIFLLCFIYINTAKIVTKEINKCYDSEIISVVTFG